MDPLIGTGLVKVGLALIDRVFPDKQAKAEAKIKLLELQQSGNLEQLGQEVKLLMGQIATNQIEAKMGTFRGGWRPFIGWVCGVGLAYNFLVHPLFVWIAFIIAPDLEPPPRMDLTHLIAILTGMLGLVIQRGREKMNGQS